MRNFLKLSIIAALVAAATYAFCFVVDAAITWPADVELSVGPYCFVSFCLRPGLLTAGLVFHT